MTSKQRLKDSSIKIGLLVFLFFLSLKSCVVNGKSLTCSEKALATKVEKTGKPIYLGYEVSLGYNAYTLESDIPQLKDLRVSYFGGTAGGVLANQLGKLKINAALYYSDDSTPYTFDLSAGNISANLYLLRLREIKYHTLEPYMVGGVSRQQTKFYGTYLNDGTQQNFNTLEEPLLAKVVATQFNVGLGAEYQLENDQGNFIHLFAEVVCGVPVATQCPREAFDGTRIINPVSISFGISCGIIKQRSK